MAETETLEQLKRLIADVCAVDAASIGGHARLRGYGLDSLRALELIMAIEGQFDVHVGVESVARIHTVGQLAQYVDTLRTQGTGEVNAEQPR